MPSVNWLNRPCRSISRCALLVPRTIVPGCSHSWPRQGNRPAWRRQGAPRSAKVLLKLACSAPASTIIRTTFLLFYDKFLQYVTKFATMTSGQRSKSVVHPEQRYSYMPCPLYDTGKCVLCVCVVDVNSIILSVALSLMFPLLSDLSIHIGSAK